MKSIETQRIVLSDTDEQVRAEALRRAVDLLRLGEVVAFPTDTVYGLGGDPLSESSLAALFAAKGRPEDKPIALLVSGSDQVHQVTTDVPPLAWALMERFWPGPLTLVLRAAAHLPPTLLAGRETVGVRMPDHDIVLALLAAYEAPLAVTSANLSGEPDLRTGEEVEAALNDRIPFVLDGGRTPGGSASTVLDLTASPPRILRSGPISEDDLRELI